MADRSLARWLDEDPDWERIASAGDATLCFRCHPRGWPDDDPRLDRLNRQLRESVNATRALVLGGARVHGRYVLSYTPAPGEDEPGTPAAWEILHAEALRLGVGPTVVA